MTDTSPELGRLENVRVRDVWAHEAHAFTPWLLTNGERLAEALGIELELTHSEHPVGGFSLDIIGRDLTHDAVLIVENQLEDSDHTHLGQLLTYAAGAGAATIVWIAPRIREEHRQALNWLNENTGEDVHFFGVEIEVVRIGDSVPAPLFRLAAKPNDWQKSVRAATTAVASGSKGPLYFAFWEKFLARIHAEHPTWSRARPPSQNWLNMPTGRSGIMYGAVFVTGERIRHELYIDLATATECKAYFDHLHAQRAQVEAAYGRTLVWERLDGKKACRVGEYRPGEVGREDEHQAYLDFFVDAGLRLRSALSAADVRQ